MSNPRWLSASVPFTEPRAAEKDDEIDVLGVFRTLWRGKWWILLFTVIGVALGGYYAFRLAVPLYTSEAVVALEDREGNVVDLKAVMGGLSADQATINTEVEVIRSRQIIGKLVKTLDLTSDPEFNPALRPVEPYSVGWLKTEVLGLPAPRPLTDDEVFRETVDTVLDAVRVSNPRDSYVFQIRVETTSPQKSATIANTLADRYITDQLDLKFEATEKASSWLKQQLATLKAELETASKKLEDFTASTQLVSPEALAGLSVQLKDLRERLSGRRAATDDAAARLASLEDAADEATPTELAKLAGDPALTAMAERVEAGSVPREAFDARLAKVIEAARAEQARGQRQVDILQSSVTELEGRIEKQSSELVTLQQLQRESEASALIYESFLSRMKELTVQQGLHKADARLLSEAVIRDSPSAPRVGVVLGLSGLIAIFFGSGFVLVRERLQNVFRTAEELEQFAGIPVVGQIPAVPAARRRKLLQYIVSKPASAFAEAVRTLRTSILLTDVDKPPKVIMLTSTAPGEGKTTQSLSLARSFSTMGKTVLLIEADIRRRTFSEYFETGQGAAGLVTAVAGDRPYSEAVIRNEELGMDVLLGEKSHVNAADFFSSKRFAEFLKTARNAYDVVILDTPPVLAVPDARVIGQLADAIIYVVHWDRTPKPQVAAGLRAFERLKLRVTGLVLSQVDPKGMKRYGHGGNYGAYYEN